MKFKKSVIGFVIIIFIMNIPMEVFSNEILVKAKETHQTMVGFGASIGWYENTLTSHPQKEDIYYQIFDNLGLDILLLRNVYRNDPNFAAPFAEIVGKLYEYSPDIPKVLISSWSPPYDIKSNNSTSGGSNATLKKNTTTNKFMYGEFGQYWVDALGAYRNIGIEPDYISIQNEPSYDASWESCRFEPTEGTVAGYDKALDSVYFALQQAGFQTKILAPECHGIGYNTFQNYAARYNHTKVDGYAYHLYHGESDNVSDNHNPDLFNTNLANIGNNYKSKPIFQTEYDRGSWFNTVWLMHNCLVNGNVSAYFWWELVWGSGGKPLIEMQSTTFTISKYYWAFRQYSKFISSGWKRVSASSDTDSLRVSAFINPDGNSLTVVVINLGSQTKTMNFALQDFSVTNGEVIRTSETESGNIVSSSYNGTTSLDFPSRSITTIAFSGTLVTSVNELQYSNPSEYSLSQNYPNPFNPSTKIQFTLGKEQFVSLKIYDILGREISTLVQKELPGGIHSVDFDAAKMNSGIYVYRITAGDFTESRKMLLLR